MLSRSPRHTGVFRACPGTNPLCVQKEPRLSPLTCFFLGGTKNQGAPKGRQQKGETGPGTHIFADFCRFSLIFGSLCKLRDLGVAGLRRKPQETAEFSQETAENLRFLQKPVSPICCLPFGALLKKTHELKKNPRDTRRVSLGHPAGQTRVYQPVSQKFLVVYCTKADILQGHRPGVPGTLGRPRGFQKFYVIFSDVPFLSSFHADFGKEFPSRASWRAPS